VEFEKWEIPGFDEPFVQDPLNFFEKNEFLALVARALEDSLAGGADIEAVLTLLGMDEDKLRAILKGDMQNLEMGYIATSLFNVITRLITTAPRLLEDLYLIALSVPPEQRPAVREHLRQIDDDTGFGILEAFVKQNATTIRDFFPRWRALLESTMESLRAAADTSPTSND
jgi:hypothetical protein